MGIHNRCEPGRDLIPFNIVQCGKGALHPWVFLHICFLSLFEIDQHPSLLPTGKDTVDVFIELVQGNLLV